LKPDQLTHQTSNLRPLQI